MSFSLTTCSYCDKQVPTVQEQTMMNGQLKTITFILDHDVRLIDVTGNERTFRCPNPGQILTVS